MRESNDTARRDPSAAPFPWSLSFVYPAYNEEANIETTVRDTAAAAERLLADWEIVVVNDGSADATGEILARLGEEIPRLRVVDHGTNRGYGAAVKSGFSAASKDLVFFSDSDGQFVIEEIEDLLPHIEDHDIVTGYRRKRQDPLHRRLNAFGWNSLTRLVLGTGVRDINCAFKLFRRGVFDHITIRSEGALINAEVFGKARRLGMMVHEVPVTHLPRLHGTQTGAHPGVILRAFRELVQLYEEIRTVGKRRRGSGPAVPLPSPMERQGALAATAAMGGASE